MIYVLVLYASCIVLYFIYSILSLYLKDLPRRRYVIKNVVKSLVLFVLVLFSFVFLRSWDNDSIKAFASVYVSNDLMALLMCRDELPRSTYLHHMTSVLFMLAAFQTDFEASRTAQMLFYYTYASAWAFPVNLYLGLRLCFQKRPAYLETLQTISLYNYATICVLNWSYQIYLFDYTPTSMAYFVFLIMIVYDDIVLLKWLYSH